MNKIIVTTTIIMAMALFALPTLSAHASVLVPNNNLSIFGIEIIDINKIKETNLTQFSFQVIDIVNPQNIAYWKLRTRCDKDISVNLAGIEGNVCGKAVKIQLFSSLNNEFILIMNNSKLIKSNFSFKLKAYDANGNWLHSEKESFRWK